MELTFIAKVATPVGVTQALPGLYASAVYAARVGDALVTVLALPAIQTPARHKRAMPSALEVGQIKSQTKIHTCYGNAEHMQDIQENSHNHGELG